ncbi:hypothetical protein NDU88_000985 [Pleurodeles waltl]|uniref:Uncharacterized protein n=1 Tax=Pleurodeles waltl TaxID=8319 RepID=A0AAV7MM55_PLEWA|nr:hypothetical protein NDU88_000985 [Pleurodeles waltl]
MTMAETANRDSHFTTLTATAIETNIAGGNRQQTGGRQCTAHCITTGLSATFSGVVPTRSKEQRKQDLRGKPLTSRHPTRNQDAMEPELHVLPMLVFLLLFQEHERRRRRPRKSPPASDGCPLGMIAMSAVVPLSEHVAGLVVVLAAVSVAEVLTVVHVSAPIEGHSRTSPAASDGCPLGMMLGTVAEAADV